MEFNLKTVLKCASASYEGSLFGWDMLTNQEDGALAFDMKYGFHCSRGSIKCICISPNGRYLVCGSSNEKIHIYDMKTMKSVGDLTKHTGAVTCLEFVDNMFLISGSEDNTICIWRVHDWQCLHILGGHKEAVNDISIHPSGKVALSVGKDTTLRMWNLITGKCAFTRSLKEVPTSICWNKNDGGLHYLVVFNNKVKNYTSTDNVCIGTIEKSKYVRVSHAEYCTNGVGEERIVVLYDDKHLTLYKYDGTVVANILLNNEMITSGEDKNLAAAKTVTASGGKPKSIHICYPTYKVASEEGSIVDQDDCTIVVVTTNGCVLACSSTGLEEFYGPSASPSDTSKFESVVRCSAGISAEPRLTCVVAWTPPNEASIAPGTQGAALLSGCENMNNGDDVQPAPDSESRNIKKKQAKTKRDRDVEDTSERSKKIISKPSSNSADSNKKKKIKFKL